MRAKLAEVVGAIAAVVALEGCAGHAARTEDARSALDALQPRRALQLINEELGVDRAEDLPAKAGGDNALLLLDRAMILMQLARHDLSSRDLEVADKQIEILDLSKSAAEDVGKYLFSDDVGGYRAPPYEKLLINSLNMVNYLERADLNGARIEARRLAVMNKYLSDHEDAGQTLVAPGAYLAGWVFEKSGRADEALRWYDQALAYGRFASLEEPVRRLSVRGGYRSPRLRELIGEPAPAAAATPAPAPAPTSPAPAVPSPAPAPGATPPQAPPPAPTAPHSSDNESKRPLGAAPKKGAAPSPPPAPTPTTPAPAPTPTVAPAQQPAPATPPPETPASSPPAAAAPEPAEILAVIDFGRVPAKYAKRIPIGLALTYASGAISPYDRGRANHLAAQGLVTWVNYPEIERSRRAYPTPGVKVDGDWQVLEQALDVDKEARRAWEEARGTVVAAAVMRTIARIIAGEVARRGIGGVEGILVGLATQATLTATDTPDTRSWSTLPARITISRVRVEPGEHWVELHAQGLMTRRRVVVKPGGSAVVSLTVLG